MSYMIQTILPSLMMVLCSYGSLFIPHDQVSNSGLNFVCRLLLRNCPVLNWSQVPGRMALSITTTLTLVTLSNGLFNTSPRTSYLKAWFISIDLLQVARHSNEKMFRLAGDRRVAAGLFPLLRDGPRWVLRHRLLLQSPLHKTSDISKSFTALQGDTSEL